MRSARPFFEPHAVRESLEFEPHAVRESLEFETPGVSPNLKHFHRCSHTIGGIQTHNLLTLNTIAVMGLVNLSVILVKKYHFIALEILIFLSEQVFFAMRCTF